MFGFVLGVLSVGALVAAYRAGARRGRWRRWGGGHRRGGWVLNRILRRLDARPDQEAEIQKVLQELFAELRQHRDTFTSLRDDLASAVAGESAEPSVLDGAFSKVDGASASARDAVRKAFARLHGVLDAQQRARLAELLRGGMWAGGPGCHRAAAHPVQL